ncbi:MAG TPA: hypothetical protein V6D46_05420 [Coleofasciculaceae cyanobacterium]
MSGVRVLQGALALIADESTQRPTAIRGQSLWVDSLEAYFPIDPDRPGGLADRTPLSGATQRQQRFARSSPHPQDHWSKGGTHP